jgi:hypothetical protein
MMAAIAEIDRGAAQAWVEGIRRQTARCSMFQARVRSVFSDFPYFELEEISERPLKADPPKWKKAKTRRKR